MSKTNWHVEVWVSVCLTRPGRFDDGENSRTIFTVLVTIRIYGVYWRTEKLIRGGDKEKNTLIHVVVWKLFAFVTATVFVKLSDEGRSNGPIIINDVLRTYETRQELLVETCSMWRHFVNPAGTAVRHKSGRTDSCDACSLTQQTEMNIFERFERRREKHGKARELSDVAGDRDDLLAIPTVMHNSIFILVVCVINLALPVRYTSTDVVTRWTNRTRSDRQRVLISADTRRSRHYYYNGVVMLLLLRPYYDCRSTTVRLSAI